METEWQQQMRDSVNTIEKLEQFIKLSDSERKALENLKTTWGTTPYVEALMDRDDPKCPIRKQVIPSMSETENRFGVQDYLTWKENRATSSKSFWGLRFLTTTSALKWPTGKNTEPMSPLLNIVSTCRYNIR